MVLSISNESAVALTNEFDAVVIGGGPCGSFSALTAAKLGTKVAICEEHESVGIPTHCTGHLNLNGLKRLTLHPLPKNMVENEFKDAIFYSPSGKKFSIRFNSPVTCSVNRELFDKYLADLAMKAGVEYHLGSRVESLILEERSVKGVVVNHQGFKETVSSEIVIDAEGVSSVILRKAGLQSLDRSMIVNAVHVEVDRLNDVEDDLVEVYLGEKYAPGFFAWIIPKPKGTAKIGLATNTGNPKEYLHKFIHGHPIASPKLNKSKILHQSFHPISLGGPIPKTYHHGLLVVGDAASQVKPTTGGGVIFGLLCSKIAGEVAHEAIKNNNFSKKFLSRYQNRWKALIGFELTLMRRLRIMLNSLSDKRIDKIIELCASLEMDRVLKKHGDLDFEGASLIRMLSHPATFILSFYFIFSSFIH
jgi:geranylgeranyl reductase family protein